MYWFLYDKDLRHERVTTNNFSVWVNVFSNLYNDLYVYLEEKFNKK